jgi:pullulanase/glycogen debranching enzyme
VNFSLFSRSATGVELLFFDREDDARPARVIRLDPAANRTYYYWHVYVPGVQPGQLYGYRVAGLCDPAHGMRLDPAKVLLDPYGRRVVVPQNYSRDAARQAGDNAATAMKSVVVDVHTYDWDPVLAGTKLIAEAWDAAGLYQVGSFIGDSWKEWNGRFRDDVRSFFRGDEGTVGRLADRLLGSPEIYGHKEREAEQSVNFVTCHDGFTLNDLVSYDHKHNAANGEDNRDGANDNRSWNCGVEGPTHDPAVEQLRHRQVKNLLTVTMLSLGMPMILMGDEVRRTQHGNNNAYCQDNETSWFDWTLVAQHADIHRFVTLLNARRLLRDMEHERQAVPGSTYRTEARAVVVLFTSG